MDELFISNPDWNDHYVAEAVNLTVACGFSLFVDVSATDDHRIEVFSQTL